MTASNESRPKDHRRIGVFGGTFDPPHIGHLVAAVDARQALDLDVVLMVVANVPWQKVGERAISPAPDRLAMVRAAVADRDGLEVSDLEIRRGGESFTADSLAELHRHEPDAELYVILGRDAAAGFSTWERHEEVAQRAELVVVDRPGPGPMPDPEYRWIRVDIPELEISSTELRARVKARRSIDYLTPPAVVTYISRRGLYR
ncbi:MAG: nicotinate-nucleotide adenylyltransferase [Acidimicrobiales bacterium]|jgi:nicotinate-nucleotide adenylyltransferase